MQANQFTKSCWNNFNLISTFILVLLSRWAVQPASWNVHTVTQLWHPTDVDVSHAVQIVNSYDESLKINLRRLTPEKLNFTQQVIAFLGDTLYFLLTTAGCARRGFVSAFARVYKFQFPQQHVERMWPDVPTQSELETLAVSCLRHCCSLGVTTVLLVNPANFVVKFEY